MKTRNKFTKKVPSKIREDLARVTIQGSTSIGLRKFSKLYLITEVYWEPYQKSKMKRF